MCAGGRTLICWAGGACDGPLAGMRIAVIGSVAAPLVRHPNRVFMLAAAVVATGAAGNALLRVGLSSAGPILTFSPLAYLKEFGNVAVVAGVVALIARLILQLSLLSWADLTYAIPVTSASYVVITLVGAFGLHEHVSAAHWSGVMLILFGVMVVGRTKPLTTGNGQT